MLRRTTKNNWPPWILAGCLAAFLLSALAPDADSACLLPSLPEVSPADGLGDDEEDAPEEAPVPVRDFSLRPVPRIVPPGDSAERDADPAPARGPLAVRPLPRLDACGEYTKPDSLKLWQSGTPKGLRSPPA